MATRVMHADATSTRDAETLYRIAEELPDSVVLTDAEGRVLWVNAALCALLECTVNDVLGKAIEDLMPTEEVLKLIGLSCHLEGADLARDLNVFLIGPSGTRASVVATV